MVEGHPKIVLAFDAYGTLLSTESIAQTLGEHFGRERAQEITTRWRKYQLEYTWRLNSMGQYMPFSTITRRSAHHAMAESGILDWKQDEAIDELMQAYDALSIFPDVGPALEWLATDARVTAYVFSNGTHTMVSNSVHRSPQLSPFAKTFRDIVVVEPVQKYKPAPEVYNMLVQAVGKADQKSDVWLISGNPFDVVGARAVGMNAAWVDRAGSGWQDQLVDGEKGRPSVMGKDLKEVLKAVKKHAGL